MRCAGFALTAALFCAAPALAGGPGALPVETAHLTDRSPVYTIAVAYPRTGDAKIDADLFATVNTIVQSFRKEARSMHDAHDGPYSLVVTFRVARNDAKMFAAVFTDEWDFHGAHPNDELVTANYLRAGSWRVYLPELFDGARGLARISALATADLDRQLLVGANAMTDPAWIARGADAHWDNFADFVLLPDALEVDFPPYAVAAYAAGVQTARIPLARLKDVLRPDPKKPVASFDCGRAATADERAICSDVALARLDREVDESWSSQMRSENDPKRRDALKADQTAWLDRRDNACRTGPRVPCLTALYEARLSALEDRE